MDLLCSHFGILDARNSLGRKEYGGPNILVSPVLYCFCDFFDWNSRDNYLPDNLCIPSKEKQIHGHRKGENRQTEVVLGMDSNGPDLDYSYFSWCARFRHIG